MFTLRAAPRHYPECYWDRRPSTCRQAFSPGHMSRPTRDSQLLQDLTESILLPFLGTITGNNENTPCRQHDRPKIKQWTHRLNLKGYGPDDVTITTREGRVLIKARRIEGQGDCSDIYESHRTITIPKDVDVSSMKSRFTPDGMLTIEAKFLTKDENQTIMELEVQLDKAEHKQNSEPIQDGKVNATEEREDGVSEPYIEGEQIQSASHRDDVTGGADPESVIEYPESVDSFHEKEDFEIVEPKMPSINGDLDPNQETDVTIEHDQYLYNHKPGAGPCSHNKQETGDEDLNTNDEEVMTTRGEDDKRVSDDTTKRFTLSFNKDQFTGDDVRVLLKGNTLLVKSERKESKDGVFRTEYYATQYTLPDDVDVNKLSCSKKSDGELSVTAPYKELDI